MDRLKIVEIKRLRGLIIKALFDAYPKGLLKTTIIKAFQGNHSSIDIEREIEYLKGKKKEYIEEVKVEDCCLDEGELLRITPKGYDLMQESIPDDPGVEF